MTAIPPLALRICLGTIAAAGATVAMLLTGARGCPVSEVVATALMTGPHISAHINLRLVSPN